MIAKNTICLWYDKDAEEAARFYAKTFPDSRVGAVHKAPSDNPSSKEGEVLVVDFTVCGIPCMGLNGGPMFKHNEVILVPDRHRRSGRDGSLLECHRRQRRAGERLRLVQGQMGRLLADHAARADRGVSGRRRRGQTRLRRDDGHEEDRCGEDREGKAGVTPRLPEPPCRPFASLS